MIIIPRNIYDEVNKNRTVSEDDIDYEDMLDGYLARLEEKDALAAWLKNRAKFVGAGSSRVAFLFDNGLVLKVANNEAGKAQNRQEYETTVKINNDGKYTCFSKIYRADTKNWEAIVCEAATTSTKQDFIKLTDSFPLWDIAAVIYKSLFGSNKTPEEIKKEKSMLWRVGSSTFESLYGSKEDCEQYFYNQPDFFRQIDKIIKKENKTFENFSSLSDYYTKFGVKSLLPKDLESPQNWGVVNRGKGDELIIIDAGFSKDVASKYYTVYKG